MDRLDWLFVMATFLWGVACAAICSGAKYLFP